MNSSITVQESTHWLWKTGTIISGITCIVFFAIFWNISDPFWTGIFRLCSFVFFAIAMLSYLQMMDGPLKITLRSDKDLLLVAYEKKGKEIQEEQFERNTIEEIVPIHPEKKLLSLLQPNTVAFRINFNDTDRNLYLFQFRGRPLLFDQSSQKEIMDYLKKIEVKF
jgi:hypothetical protein